MEQVKFATYNEYVESQRRLSLHKAVRGRVFCVQKTVEMIRAYHTGPRPELAICHGVRKGGELPLFRNLFGGHWIGTEITSELCNGVDVLHWDFSEWKPEWDGTVDILYSNSLDHARDPAATLRVWVDSLKPWVGRMYIEWCPWHNKLGHGWKNADCFAADKPEYGALLADVGTVHAVLDIGDSDKFERVVFAVGPKQ